MLSGSYVPSAIPAVAADAAAQPRREGLHLRPAASASCRAMFCLWRDGTPAGILYQDIGPEKKCYSSHTLMHYSVSVSSMHGEVNGVIRAINNGRPSAIFRAKSAFDQLSNNSSGHSGRVACILHQHQILKYKNQM